MQNKKITFRRMIQGLIFHTVSIMVSILFILPLYWMLVASLRQPGLPPPITIEWLPQSPTWSNYVRIFQMLPLRTYIFNSLTVAGSAVCITLFTASLAGFAMAQLSLKWQKFFLVTSVILLVIPNMAVWLARFFLVRELGLFNSHAALILPSLMGTSPLFILLFYWNFRTIPAELFEAAHLDGAGPFAIWWRIALPLSKATIIVVGILTFLLYWGDFASPMFYLKSQELYTLPVGLRQLQEMDRTNWPLLLAGSVVMTLPAVFLFSIVQHYFLQENRLSGIYGQ